MNVTLMRLKPVVRELREISRNLERLADCWEIELSQVNGINVRPPKADTSGPDPTIDYVDEELDFVRESIARYQREDELKSREEE